MKLSILFITLVILNQFQKFKIFLKAEDFIQKIYKNIFAKKANNFWDI